jgi:hypothetical protein
MGVLEAEAVRKERKGRGFWFVRERVTITPPPPAEEDLDDLFGESVLQPPARVEEVGERIAYSDGEIANLRAAERFVECTFRSMSGNLDRRSEKKK